jgi:membrane protease YdiL (CAAX protease family)
MNPFDQNPPQPPHDQPAPDQSPDTTHQDPLDDLASRIVVHPVDPSTAYFSSDGLAAGFPPPAPPPDSYLPPDLRIPWSWLHLLLFALFAFGSILFIQLGLIFYLSATQHLTPSQVEQAFRNRPDLAVGSNVLWFFLIFLFLYMTLAAYYRRPFWPTLGWKKLGTTNPDAPSSPWVYIAGGAGLAICVAILSSKIKTPEHLPIQDLFKNRTGALLLMGMAVLVAPLVEETVFRGYLYPLFASTGARIARANGADPVRSVEAGTRVGILITGTLFGFLHGAQLGWTWALVAVLSVVGIVFTWARARVGSVYASYFLHLGYNSFIAFSAIFATRGFTKMPPTP